MKGIVIRSLAIVIAILPFSVKAQQPAVPSVLAFQSSLYDDGGNPVADGPATVTFRILDVAGAVLYEERQTPDIVRGELSALVGNGLTAAGAPTGGIPDGLFAPGAARYLEAEVDGQPPTAPLEIASVPYALHAGEALEVADGGVAFEDLKEDVVGALAAALANEVLGASEVIVRSDLATMYRDPSSAATIGVASTFVSSSADNLQGVLDDLDGALETEARARVAADAAEAAARQAADAALQASIQTAVADLTPPPNAFSLKAWGHVAVCINGAPSVSGGNVSGAQQIAQTQCRVTFAAPMTSADYAIVNTAPTAVVGRDASGFTVSCGGSSSCAFDFIAIAP